jgi:lactoylglutathione lyase
MKIEHIAVWVHDLEKMKSFYVKYFSGVSNEKYYNPKKEFSSYFITFAGGARLELMHAPSIAQRPLDPQVQSMGIVHFAFSTGSRDTVIALTEELRRDGCAVVSEPRVTGDGYFESCILDYEGNRVEITE